MRQTVLLIAFFCGVGLVLVPLTKSLSASHAVTHASVPLETTPRLSWGMTKSSAVPVNRGGTQSFSLNLSGAKFMSYFK